MEKPGNSKKKSSDDEPAEGEPSKTPSGKKKTKSSAAGKALKSERAETGSAPTKKGTGSTPRAKAKSSATVAAATAPRGSNSNVLIAIGLLIVGLVAALVIVGSSSTPPPKVAVDESEPDAPQAPDAPKRPKPRAAAKPVNGGDDNPGGAGPAEPAEKGRSALILARKATMEGNYDKALSLLTTAEEGGVPKDDIARERAKVQAAIAADKRWKSIVANVKDLESKGAYDEALEMLNLAAPTAIQVNHETDLKELVKEVQKLKGGGDPDELTGQISDALALGDVKKAAELLERLKASDADNPKVPFFTKRIDVLRKTPPGMNFIETDAASGRGLYALRKSVSNAEYKAWWSALAKDKPAAPWPGGDFAPEEGTFPVTNVAESDAERYAKSRGGRLPRPDELTAIKKSLRLVGDENEATDGVFKGAFRFVIDLDALALRPTPGGAGGPDVPGPAPQTPGSDEGTPAVGGTKPAAPPRTPQSLAALEASLKDRVQGWLNARMEIKCFTCEGRGSEKCRTCDGQGILQGVSVTHPPKCPTCGGKLRVPCTNKGCKDGVSKSAAKTRKEKFGELGLALKAFTPTGGSTFKIDSADPTKATVTWEVSYLKAPDAKATETSSWELDAKNQWRCSQVTEGVKSND